MIYSFLSFSHYYLVTRMLEMEFTNCLTSVQIWLIVIAVFILAYNQFTKEPWKKLPPGPPALPLVGSLPFLGSTDIREPLRNMAAKYGDLFTLYMGLRRVVVLSGYNAIKDAFVRHGHVFSGRPPVYFITGITNGYGIISSQGPFWREQRRYALHVLRDFGFGRSILEDRILEEVNFFVRELQKNIDVPFYPQPVLQKSVANIISSVAFGRRREYDDPVFIRYMDILNEAFEILGTGGAITVFPFLRYLPGDWFKVKKLLRGIAFMDSEFIRMIEEHKNSADREQKPTDFIGAYLEKMKDEQDNKESSYSERQLRYIIADLFGAGTETTSTTLTWAILYMALHQDTQYRVYAEIKEIIGRHGIPRMHHRSQMPFTEACILETQRLGDIVPLGVPHAVTEDIHFRGYFIPRGTMVLSNIYSVHRDPKLWPEPEQFNPERFISDVGRLVRREELIPFSIGKRLCLGEGLARMEIFLYFTSMMQNFHFRVPPGYPQPDMQGIFTLANSPKRFDIIIESRNE